MFAVGIWGENEGLSGRIAACGPEALLLRGRRPRDFAGRALDLLAAAPDARGWGEAGAIRCRALLLHGACGPLARDLRTGCAVSYGTSPKDTLTLSSMEGDQICLALQRELVTLAGAVVERQELVLPLPPDTAPLTLLAVTGTLLLLGVPPEGLDRAIAQGPLRENR